MRPILLACALTTAAAPAVATDYTITTITPAPGYSSVQIFGVNDAGQAVGNFIGSAVGVSQAFIWSAGSFAPVGGPAGALASSVLGISNTGVLVGSSYDTTVTDPGTGNPVPGPTSAWVFDGSAYTRLDLGPGTFTQARGVSPDGRWVSGYYADAGGLQRGFVLDRTSGTVTDITTPGSSFTLPQGVSTAGLVVGSDVFTSTGQRPGFTYDITSGTRMSYEFAGYSRTAFRDVTEGGVLAGWLISGALTVGFVGTPGSFETLVVNGSVNTTIQGINEAGWLVGNHAAADGVTQLGFVAVPVPEPGAALMLALGLVVMGFRLRAARSR
jgi:uncharacterized membrane protein